MLVWFGARQTSVRRQLEMLSHYGLQGHRINVRKPQENGDIESSNGTSRQQAKLLEEVAQFRSLPAQRVATYSKLDLLVKSFRRSANYTPRRRNRRLGTIDWWRRLTCYRARRLSKWEEIFKDPMTTAAAIDRLIHHSVIIELNMYRAQITQSIKTVSDTFSGHFSGSPFPTCNFHRAPMRREAEELDTDSFVIACVRKSWLPSVRPL